MPEKNHIRSMFDSIAGDYDSLNHILSLGIDRIWRRKAVSEVMKAAPMRILDAACGTGDLAVALAAKAPDGAKVTGVDISKGMLAKVGEKAARGGVIFKIRTEVADAENLPYADGSYDAVTCAFGIRNFEHRDRGLAEFLRVLRPGGKAVILELSVPQKPGLRRLYNLYFSRILPWIGGKVSGEENAYKYLAASVNAFPSPERFCTEMTVAGFRGVTFRTFSSGLCRMYVGVK
jgi:demethylmenaquinone methyltransferase/2-methoxy-6-polyprenyl-1,4-benzoquinol methylase